MRVLNEPEWILMAVKADFGRTFKGGLDADHGPEFAELKVGRLHARLRHGVWEQPSWRWEPCKFSHARKKQVLTFSINYNDYSCTMACLFHDLPRKYFVYLRSWCRLRGHKQWHTRASCVLSSFLDIKEDNKYSCTEWRRHLNFYSIYYWVRIINQTRKLLYVYYCLKQKEIRVLFSLNIIKGIWVDFKVSYLKIFRAVVI